MYVLGNGREGHITNGVTVSAALPTGSAGVSTSNPLEVIWCHIVSLQLVISSLSGAFTGTWTVEASNDYAPESGGGSYGQPPNAGTWTDVTAQWTPAVAGVTANGSQIIQSPTAGCGYRHIRVKLTRTGGTSAVADVWATGKGA